jgi:hypothetical protein
MQGYERWPEYAPMVIAVQVLHPGDASGSGLLRRVVFRLPFGRRGTALELVTDVVPNQGYRYTMISREPGNDQTGRLRLEALGPDRTRLFSSLLSPFPFQRGRPSTRCAMMFRWISEVPA